MRLTLGSIRPTIAKILSFTAADSRVVDYINEAQERLLYRGKWRDTYAKFQVLSDNMLITWPRQLETIEAFSVQGQAGVVHNQWYEFLEHGFGLSGSGWSGALMSDEGEACTFADIGEGGGKLRLYSTVTADWGKTVLIQGYDADGVWVRTQIGLTGVWIDGLNMVLGAGYAESAVFFSSVVGIQKPITQGNVELWEFNTALQVAAKIGDYEPTETIPAYRRSTIPGMATSDLVGVPVIVMGKLRFVPVVSDLDYLLITSAPALKDMVMSIRKAENNQPQDAEIYEARAIRELNSQLQQYLGDGAVNMPRIAGSSVWGGGFAGVQ